VELLQEVRMLGRGVLSRLYCLTQQETNTLTLYVNIDQNTQANRNQGFLVQGEALLKELRARHPDDQHLRTAADRAVELLEALEPQGKSALVVVHPSIDLAEVHTLRLHLPSAAHWRRGAFLRPVVEVMDEHERYGVVLTDKQRARVFSVYMGEITEHSDLVSPTSQRTQTTGHDQIWSQKRQQRHHDQEVAVHAKRVVDALHELGLRSPYDRLIIAGPKEATLQVARVLPRRLHGKLFQTISLAVTASPREVLERILEIQKGIEREQEVALVEGVLAELHSGGRAMVALAPVIEAANHGRVWKLVYAKGFSADGGECSGCGGYSNHQAGTCALCGGELGAVSGLIDRLSQGVLETGGQVEVVDGAAAETLKGLGSIAAVLRY
jgi:stalled ribosome rescue protein Dom34